MDGNKVKLLKDGQQVAFVREDASGSARLRHGGIGGGDLVRRGALPGSPERNNMVAYLASQGDTVVYTVGNTTTAYLFERTAYGEEPTIWVAKAQNTPIAVTTTATNAAARTWSDKKYALVQ